MIPQIFEIFYIPVNSFGLMLAIAFLAGTRLLSRSFVKYGINPAYAEKYGMIAIVSGLLGARLWYVFVDQFQNVKHDLLAALFAPAGFTFFGGFIFSTIAIVVIAHRDQIKLHKLADAMGPALALSYAIGRLGCQLSGDGDYGMPARDSFSFLGMSYSTGVIPTPPGVLVYPTPLYESLICLLILFVLLKFEKDSGFRSRPLNMFGLYLLLVAFERFIVEFIRINPDVVNVLSQAQVISCVLMLAGFSFLVKNKMFHFSRSG